MKKELRHDRHTVSLLTDHMVFSPKYRGKILGGDVAMVAEGVIRKIRVELDIEIIDMAINLGVRGMDAIVIQIAKEFNVPLITFDKEMIEKAKSFVDIRAVDDL